MSRLAAFGLGVAAGIAAVAGAAFWSILLNFEQRRGRR